MNHTLEHILVEPGKGQSSGNIAEHQGQQQIPTWSGQSGEPFLPVAQRNKLHVAIRPGGKKMNHTLEHILPKVQKPARYTGGEYNSVVKDRSRVNVRYGKTDDIKLGNGVAALQAVEEQALSAQLILHVPPGGEAAFTPEIRPLIYHTVENPTAI